MKLAMVILVPGLVAALALIYSISYARSGLKRLHSDERSKSLNIGCGGLILAVVIVIIYGSLVEYWGGNIPFTPDEVSSAEQFVKRFPIFQFCGPVYWLAILVSGIGLISGSRARKIYKKSIGYRRCPQCEGSNIQIERTTSHSYRTTETRTRTSRHYNKDGDETGYTETEYEAPVTETSTTTYYGCSDCAHKWSKSS